MKNLNLNLEAVQETNSTETNEFIQLLLMLLQSRFIIHIFHLRVSGIGSYASHLAFGDLYESLGDFADKLCEQYQGQAGQLIKFPNNINFNIPLVGKEIEYIQQIFDYINIFIDRYDNLDKITSNILQELSSIIRSALYKLTFLK
jgi:DNA-binding ferritin-like protein